MSFYVNSSKCSIVLIQMIVLTCWCVYFI